MRRRAGTVWEAWSILLLMACLFLAGSPARAQGAVTGPTELVPPSRSANDRFGSGADLSADGNTAVVLEGCGGFGFPGTECLAHVFVRSGESWTLETTIDPPRLGPHNIASVALSAAGDILLISMLSFDCNGGPLACGTAFLYARTPQGWSVLQQLTPSTGETINYFGYSVALSADGTTALVSNIVEDCAGRSDCGAVYVFERSGGIWTERQKLFPSHDRFFGAGLVLSADGGTLLARGDTGGGTLPGAIYVFRQSGGSWSQDSKILSPPFVSEFAVATALSGDGRTVVTLSTAGTFPDAPVHFFVRNGAGWQLQATLSGTYGDVALSADGNTALVGSRLFRRNGENWEELPSLPVTGNVAGPVDLSGATVLIGNPGATCSAGPSCGQAFVFELALLAPAAVPTLGEWGLILLALLLAASGAAILARRRRSGDLIPAR